MHSAEHLKSTVSTLVKARIRKGEKRVTLHLRSISEIIASITRTLRLWTINPGAVA